MSIADFVRDPVTYSRSHIVQFTHGAFPPAQAAMQVAQVQNNWNGAWTAEEYQQVPGQFTEFTFIEAGLLITGATAGNKIGKGDTASHTVRPGSGAVDRGIRYLPWKADTCTYMALDGNALTFFTGPLSGCSIFLGTDANGGWWAFHCNRNNQPGANNTGLKTAMVIETTATLPAPVRIQHEARYNRDYMALGFVCGRIKHQQWEFYVVDTALQAPTGDHQYHFTTAVRRLP